MCETTARKNIESREIVSQQAPRHGRNESRIAMHTLQNIVYLRNYGIDRQSVLWKLTGVRGWPHVTNMTGHEAQEAAEGEDLLKNGKLQPQPETTI